MARLREAVLQARAARIEQLAAELDTHSPEAAAQVSLLAKDFRYADLSSALDAVRARWTSPDSRTNGVRVSCGKSRPEGKRMTDSNAPANVLIVDDTADNLRLLTGILEQLGYEVRPATSGAQALQAAEHAPPDLVLLDVTMPEMDGYEVCRRLKANPKLKDVPVIFLTALSDIADKVKAFEVGGVDYITKPFHLEEVQAGSGRTSRCRSANVELARSYEKLQAARGAARRPGAHGGPRHALAAHGPRRATSSFLKDECNKLGPDAAA